MPAWSSVPRSADACWSMRGTAPADCIRPRLRRRTAGAMCPDASTWGRNSRSPNIPPSGPALGPASNSVRLSARMTSVKDQATGLQLVREFTLDAATSHLTCKQTTTNISDRLVSTCHWSRTMSSGNGIVLIPLTPPSRFPKSYVMYGPGPVIGYEPVDPNIRVRDGFLEIVGPPARPKLGFDSTAGWFCYLTRNDLMFVKRFPVYPQRSYNEVAGLTISIWYFRGQDVRDRAHRPRGEPDSGPVGLVHRAMVALGRTSFPAMRPPWIAARSRSSSINMRGDHPYVRLSSLTPIADSYNFGPSVPALGPHHHEMDNTHLICSRQSLLRGAWRGRSTHDSKRCAASAPRRSWASRPTTLATA